MTMNRSGLYRLIIKPLASSSFGKEAFHGCLIGRFKQYSTIPEEPEPFSILHPRLWLGIDGSWKNSEASSYETLGPGMALLRDYINNKGQVDIVNTIVSQTQTPEPFYEYRNQDGVAHGLYMMTFGQNWDPITRYEKRCRRDDGSEPPAMPYNFIYLAENAIKDAQGYLNELPSMRPDICVANFYSIWCRLDRLGLHQDCDESSDSLEKGLPVVSIYIGDSVEFRYGHTRDVSKLSKVRLNSGDVLIFGSESRLIYHQVKKIFTDTAPTDFILASPMRLGCLNLILKQV